MKLLTFRGGIHPDDKKEQTSGIPIEELKPDEFMVFPMSQHIGAPCAPCVEVGDYVKMYQKIGEAQGFISANIFSSVSGTVTAIEPRAVASGQKVLSVIIQNDFKDEKEDVKPLPEDASIADIALAAGAVGMGGATFPTHVKLSPPKDKPIDTIIINGSECEPYLTSDHRVLLERGEEVAGGLDLVLKKLGVKRGFIAIENNKADAAENMRKIASKYPDIEVVNLKTKYPQGSEKQLISAVTGREVPSGGLPADVGVIVLNVDSATVLYNAAKYGTPLTSRIVTVAGSAIKEPKNFRARLGMSAQSLIDAAGGFSEKPGKVIFGGPMMGLAVSDTSLPIIKGTGSILCLSEKEAALPESMSCIRCGRCVSACPIHLLPLNFCNYAEVRDWDSCKKYNILDCIECGSCSYVCPSKRHIVQSVRLAKQALREQKK